MNVIEVEWEDSACRLLPFHLYAELLVSKSTPSILQASASPDSWSILQ